MSEIIWKYGKPGADKQDIEDIEILLGIRFPKAFVQCALINNGGRPVPCAIDFEGREAAVFHKLLRIEKDAKEGIISVSEGLRGRLPVGYVPFASDPFGNYFCFAYPCIGEPTVVFWDHEEQSDDAISPVCSSFEKLLLILHD